MNNAIENKQHLAETLNDLVKIHHDRIEGYNKAATQSGTTNPDLNLMFRAKATESEQMAGWLKSRIVSLGGEYSNDTTVPGKIFRAWMDVKNTFNPKDRSSILDSCEFGEDAALKAYDMALQSDAEMDAETRQELVNQMGEIRNSHDTIKKYRDLHKG